ncbi:MAG: TIGR03936 family radical SAM-associated protein [Planctomycetota bacterium]
MTTKLPFLMRFTKKGKARYLSHRELLNLIEQAIRRSDIPVVFSEGFNPRPRISFLTALPLGISSEDEMMYFHLSEWVKQDEIIRKLNRELVEGITITRIEPLRQGSIGGFSVEYQVAPLTDDARNELRRLSPDKIKNWMLQPEQIILRDYTNKESKRINLKAYVQRIELKDDSLFLAIRITNEGTARPEEVLWSLGIKSGIKDGSFAVNKLKTLK